MALVTHLDGLRRQGPQVDAVAAAQGGLEQWSKDTLDPAQPIDNIRAVGSIAKDFAEALVEGAMSTVTSFGVLDHHHGHRGRRDPGHRPNCLMLVAWRQFYLASLGPRRGVIG